jgi:hypothetical protein
LARFLSLSSAATFQELKGRVELLFNDKIALQLDKRLNLSYRDQEGEFVDLRSEFEFEQAKQLVGFNLMISPLPLFSPISVTLQSI